nr:hypothetical protein [Bradyrhizobium sp. 139]
MWEQAGMPKERIRNSIWKRNDS